MKRTEDDWHSYFMRLAYDVAHGSKDVDMQVGCVLRDVDNTLLATGYNGPPRGAPDDELPHAGEERRLWYIHSEVNALLAGLAAVGRRMGWLSGVVLYCTNRPCADCLRLASHLGIRRVIYGVDTLGAKRPASEELARLMGVTVQCI
jgi:dCMP deaminase